MRSIILPLLSVLLFTAPFLVRADGVDDPDVTVLTEDNFDQFINQDIALVEFYAPWCGHCKTLAPEYAKAATELLSLTPSVPLGKVDATAHGSLAGRYQVSGYPTMKVFRNGKPTDYNGPRKADGIVAYMKKQAQPAVTALTEKSIDKFVKDDKDNHFVVVGFFDSSKKTSQLSSSFTVLSNKLRDDMTFGRLIDAPETAKKYGVDGSEGIVVFSYGERIPYTGSAKASTIEEFLHKHAVPLIGQFTEKNMQLYRNKKLPLAKVYMRVDNEFQSKNMKYYLNRFKKVAAEFEDKIVTALVNKKDFASDLERLSLNSLSDKEFAIVVEDENKQYKYEPKDDDYKKIDVDAIKKFFQSVLDGDADTYVRSERAPKNNNGPVKIATGKNFKDLVEDEDKDVMIEFYAPWCGHCKQLEPKYEQLGKKFKGNDKVVIAKIDATANDFDRSRWAVSGYPTIYFRKAGSTKIEKYEGARDVDDMYNWIKEHGKHAGKKTKKDKKKKKKSKKSKAEDDDDE